MKDYVCVMCFVKCFDFGCVWINIYILLVVEMLYGGFKYLGYGKDFLMYGFEDYMWVKYVMLYIGEQYVFFCFGGWLCWGLGG